MDIMNCPECGEVTVRAGLAYWPGFDEPVMVIECSDESCGWIAIDDESAFVVTGRAAASAA
ncbi:hypothetical protein SAMN04489806_1247 [Paramicrobacterium humi]|uniref:Uncharacterized protein n=1 Tax=Paramicrobacterium humi TaxID=640635 RepID=A0A1H4KNY4_9MICO|nr:hypothetical protein [Microbacterium humi]SEB60220.1 hypothetical protein SAMN04489806_1247 [Microbacterium humi]